MEENELLPPPPKKNTSSVVDGLLPPPPKKKIEESHAPSTSGSKTVSTPSSGSGVKFEPIKLTDEERYGQGVAKTDVLTPVSDEEKLLRDKLDKDKKEATAIEGSFGKKQDEIKEKEKTFDWKRNVADYLRRIVGDSPPQEGEPMITEVEDDPTPIDITIPIKLESEKYMIGEKGFPILSENLDPELAKRVFMKNLKEFSQAQKDFEQIKPVLENIKTVGQAKRALGIVDGDLTTLATELQEKQQKIDTDYKRVRELNANKLTEMGIFESFESGMEQTTKANEVADLLVGGTDKELENTLESMYVKNVLYGDREKSEVAEMIGGQVKPMGVTFTSAIVTGNPLVAAGVGTGYYARLGAGSEAIQAYMEARAQGKRPSDALSIAREQSKSGAVAGGAEGLLAATLPISKAMGSLKIASPFAKAIVKGASEAGVDAIAAAGAQTWNNYNANKNGLIRDLSDGVADQATAEAVFSVGFQLLFHGAAKLSPKNYKQLVTSYSKYDFNTIQSVVDDAVKQGTLNYAQAQPVLEDLRKSATAQSKLEGIEIPAEKEVEVVEIQKQIDELEQKKETASPAIEPAIEKKMEELSHELQVAAGIGLTAKEKSELNKLQTARDENKTYDKDRLKLLQKRQKAEEKKVEAEEETIKRQEEEKAAETQKLEANKKFSEIMPGVGGEKVVAAEIKAEPKVETPQEELTPTDETINKTPIEEPAKELTQEEVVEQPKLEAVSEGVVEEVKPTEQEEVGRSKQILDKAIEDYEKATYEEKVKLVDGVKKQIADAEKVEDLGGLDSDMVKAGKEFLEVVAPKEEIKVEEQNIDSAADGANEGVKAEPAKGEIGKTVTFEHAGSEKTGVITGIEKDGTYKVVEKGEGKYPDTNYSVKPKDAKIQPSPSDKIAQGLQDLAESLGVIKMAEGQERKDPVKALKTIAEGMIEQGMATAENVWQKITEFLQDKQPNVKISELLKHQKEIVDHAKKIERKSFLDTVKDSPETTPELREASKQLDEFYEVFENKEALSEADKKIKKDLAKSKEEVLSNSAPSATKSAMAIRLIKHFEASGDYDSAIEVIDAYDKQLREAGRFIQAASLWNKTSPELIVKKATRLAEKNGMELPNDVKRTILERMAQVDKMKEGDAKSKATFEVLDYIASQLPLRFMDLFDAYRYQNMLSNPKSHERNIYGNLFNTLITAPADMITEATYDYMRHPFNPAARQVGYADVKKYYKQVFNTVPKAIMATAEAFKNGYISEKIMELPSNEASIEALRKTKLPKLLTIVPRLMEAEDAFFSVLIGQGEKSRLMADGMSEIDATKKGKDMANKYLYREKLGEAAKDKNELSTIRALDGLGKYALDAKKIPTFGTFYSWFVPFITTPINIAKMGVRRSPIALIDIGVGAIRGKEASREQIAQATLGTVITGLAGVAAMQGLTTWAVPKDKKEKELFYASGRKPYSIRVGNKWIPISYLGAYAIPVAMAASLKHYNEDTKTALTDSEIQKIGEGLLKAGGYIASQTPLQGMDALSKWVLGEDDATIGKTLGFTTGQIIPFEGLVKYINTILDPIYRKSKGYVEAIEKDLPVLSKELEPILEPTGEPAKRDEFNYFLPYDIGLSKEQFDLPLEERRKILQQKELEKENSNGKTTKAPKQPKEVRSLEALR